MNNTKCKDILDIRKHILKSEEKLIKTQQELREDIESFFMSEYLINARAIVWNVIASDYEVEITVMVPELSDDKLERFTEKYQFQLVDVCDWLGNTKDYVFKYIEK